MFDTPALEKPLVLTKRKLCSVIKIYSAALVSCFLFQCLVEAVCILDCVCVEDASLVYRTFPCIKALFGRLSSELSNARVLLPIAQFYLNHGAHTQQHVLAAATSLERKTGSRVFTVNWLLTRWHHTWPLFLCVQGWTCLFVSDQARWLQWTVRTCGRWCLVGFLRSFSMTHSWHTSFYASFDLTWKA